METTSSLEIIKKLKQLGISLFSLNDFARLFKIADRNTVYKKIQRLEKKGVVQKLIKGKYLFLLAPKNDFAIANFLYQPSYISLESALSFYGITTGFPYQITSVTPKKTKTFLIQGQEYNYSRIDSSLFWGYEKTQDFLIAEKEKAIFDILYFAAKGLKTVDFDELELSEIDKKRLKNYLRERRSLLKFSQQLKL